MFQWDIGDYRRRMMASLDGLHKELSGIRAGRACASFLDPVRVDAYGSLVPLSQVGTVSVPDPRTLTVQVWDRGLAKAVEKAICQANLGLMPSLDGQLVRMSIPLPTEERRQELVKVASKYAEEARISVRNVRRDAMEILKKQQKDSLLSEDELHRHSEEVQKLTDEQIKKIDEILVHKQKEIMQI